jgi:hypothetical protein
MIFEYLKDNNISNFGYVIMFEDKPSLSILLDSHEIFNDVVIESSEGVYGAIDEYEMFIVGVTVTDEDNNIFNAEGLTDENISDMTYNVTPLYLYKVKTKGLMMEDFVNLELINLLFYDILDNYIQERIS